MKESVVEDRLKKLQDYGFKVLKLRTPGYNGVPDRMILWPKTHPGAPMFVELKAPKKDLRPLQDGVANDWTMRGVIVLPMCDTVEKVDALIIRLTDAIMGRVPVKYGHELY